MCGIAGVVKWGDQPIQEITIATLLVGNEHRGNDASGIALQQKDGAINIFKQDVPGWKLVTSDEYKEFIHKFLLPDTRAALVHARGASQGNPRDNNNNHPMYAGVSAVIHNGVIKNDSQMFNNLKLERKAETDSDILRAMIDKFGITQQGIQMLGRTVGSAAMAAVDPRYPGKLLLIRSGNPLTLASNENFFFFSSEKATLHKACRPFVKRMGMWFHSQKPDVDFAMMANNTAWIIGEKGLESHAECKICMGDYHEPWRKTYEEYGKRQEKWDNQARTNVIPDEGGMKPAHCYKCDRDYLIPWNGLYGDFTCDKEDGGCGESLWMPKGANIVLRKGIQKVN